MKQLVDNPTVVTRTRDPSKSRPQHHHSFKLGSKLKSKVGVLLISFTYFIIHFYGWGSIASRLKSNYEEIYFLPDVPGTHLIALRRTESTLKPPSSFEHGTPVLGIQLLKVHSVHWGTKPPPPPPQKNTASFFLKNPPPPPPIKSTNYPNPHFFKQSPLNIDFS